jgi:hypothetical protein
VSIIKRENEWLKETIIGEEIKRRFFLKININGLLLNIYIHQKNSLEKTLK